MKRLLIVTLNDPGKLAAIQLKSLLEEKLPRTYECKIWIKERDESYGKESFREDSFNRYTSLDDLLDQIWSNSDAILFFAATGIVIRKIAGRLESKLKDPAILVSDFKLSFIVPLISGHVGGGNQTAMEISSILPDCRAILTTGTDQQNLPAIDVFARKNGFRLENPAQIAPLSNALINGESIKIIAPKAFHEMIQNFPGFSHPSLEYRNTDDIYRHDIHHRTEFNRLLHDNKTVIIDPLPRDCGKDAKALRIRIRPFWIGCGMNRGTRKEDLFYAIERFLNEHGLLHEDIAGIASFDQKKDEEGLIDFSDETGIALQFYSEDQINSLTGEFSESMAGKYFGIKGVAEPCAVLASSGGYLFLRKHIYGDVTIAAAV